MGKVAVTEDRPKSTRRWGLFPRQRRPSVRVVLGPVLVLMALAVALAPDDWARALAGLAMFGIAYVVGWRDGRRDFAVDIFLGGGRDRTSSQAAISGPAPEGRPPG